MLLIVTKWFVIMEINFVLYYQDGLLEICLLSHSNSCNPYKKYCLLYEKGMTSTVFRLESNKFGTDNINATLICSKCDEIFSKEFPVDLEGQTIEFKCPVFSCAGEADHPYKSSEEREKLDLDLDQLENEQENSEEFEDVY
jgi:hypothetical protein